MHDKEEEALRFLDLLITKDASSTSFHFAMYRKPSHSDVYLNRSSCHLPAFYKGLVNDLKTKAFGTRFHFRGQELDRLQVAPLRLQ